MRSDRTAFDNGKSCALHPEGLPRASIFVHRQAGLESWRFGAKEPLIIDSILAANAGGLGGKLASNGGGEVSWPWQCGIWAEPGKITSLSKGFLPQAKALEG